MKKWIALFAAVCLLAGALASCNTEDKETDTDTTEDTVQGEVEDTASNDTETDADTDSPASALAVLDAVWATYGEDEKFAAAGGDYNNSVSDAPGTFDITDTASLESMLILPADSATDIDDAASLLHMMNANTFTCGAFHVTDSANVEAIAQTLRDAIQSRQWMCGFPDKLVIFTDGNYVVSLFGNEDLVNTFRDKYTGVYSNAVIAYEEAIIA